MRGAAEAQSFAYLCPMIPVGAGTAIVVGRVLSLRNTDLVGYVSHGFGVDLLPGTGEAPLPGEEPQHNGEPEACGTLPLAREERVLVRAERPCLVEILSLRRPRTHW